jgi:uncharacterized membrane protein
MEEFLTKVPRRWIGALMGLFVALFRIWFGFWKFVFILLFVGLGFVVGQHMDGDQSLEEFIQRLIPSR